ncbi:MAG: IS256 family transposase [bacterium]
MKVEISVPEVIGIINEIQEQPEKIFEMIREDVRDGVGQYLSEMMRAELTHFLGRDRYQHREGNDNYRNGSYDRHFTLKGIGQVKVDVPRDRKGEFKTQVIPRSKQYEDEIGQDLSLLFLTGVSTRTLAMISNRLIGRSISHMQVSNASKELTDAVEKWRDRDLSQENIKYLFIDGVRFDMRIADSIESTPVLVAIGVNQIGQRLVLGVQSGDKESATCWREFFKDLKRRGLDPDTVVLGVMDGLPGLERVFKEEFPKAKLQRCQVHVSRNVVVKVPRKLKECVADDMRSIFYASSKKKALEMFAEFKKKWEKEVPSAVKCLERSIDFCLTFFDFPDDEWISLRSSNIIERLNKEYKRRTKPMEIIAGENACYKLLAFISLKMELQWRSNPVGKVRYNLPCLKKLVDEKFTQKN